MYLMLDMEALMVKAFVLYFLNIKSTHGYEIQKFIQLNQMDDWTKIQSGSIYYALTKLEKEKKIEIAREEHSEGKTRKIYAITDLGRDALQDTLLSEFDQHIHTVKSDKFVTYPFIQDIDKDKLVQRIQKHIKDLETECRSIKNWEMLKVGEHTLGITKISFEMMISSLEYQIKWHESLIQDLDPCIEESKKVAQMIRDLDFSAINDLSPLLEVSDSIDIKQIKASILENPNEAEEILSQLIKTIKK